MNELSRTTNLNIIRGAVKGSAELEDKVIISFQDSSKKKSTYDKVIWANGLKRTSLLSSKLDIQSKENIEQIIGQITDQNLQSKIDYDLSIQGLKSKIFLPMISGISQGPGFSNLSSLGTLADRVLHSFVNANNKESCNVSY